MALQRPFSARHNYTGEKEITIREDAPEGLRYVAIETARQLGWSPSDLRSVVCLVLRIPPDRTNWSEYPNIWDEVTYLIGRCEWFKVYDIIEALHAKMAQEDLSRFEVQAPQFVETINHVFVEEGVGWQLVGGQIVVRGDVAFEAVVRNAQMQLEATRRPTAAKHIKDALGCLSRRPEPNAPGAAYHAMGSLECVARDVTGDPQATLGQILKRFPTLLPKPLDVALSQIWGFASEEARHVREGRDIGRQEAELLVGLSATLTTYLSGKTNI
jgi:AbiJ N-terminal domain 4